MTARHSLTGTLRMSHHGFHLIDAGGIIWRLDIAPVLAALHLDRQVTLHGHAYNMPRFEVVRLVER